MSNDEWWAQTNAARAEDLHWMIECGDNLTEVASRLGITTEAVATWCRRHRLYTELSTLRQREYLTPAQEKARAAGTARWERQRGAMQAAS